MVGCTPPLACQITFVDCQAFVSAKLLGNCLREARRSIHAGLNTMVTCRRLTPGSNRKKRHVRHVHSRRHLARRFATHRACFQKEYFIDEKVRFNGVRQQGFGVQIISGAHKPNQAGHKWNQLKVVTNALLDVALTASSAFMGAIPLIEEGVQHVHPVNKHLQSFLRSWTHEAFSVQKPGIISLYVGGHSSKYWAHSYQMNCIPAGLRHLNNSAPDYKADTGCLRCMQRGALQTVTFQGISTQRSCKTAPELVD